MMNLPAERLFTARDGASPEEQARVRANDAYFSCFVSSLFISEAAARHRGEVGLVEPDTGEPLRVEANAGKGHSEHGEILGVVTILHQVDSALAHTHGGAGLGLTISRRLARMLGGEIVVRSSPGQGSVFTLVLSQRPKGR
jgi:hypothetical protein